MERLKAEQQEDTKEVEQDTVGGELLQTLAAAQADEFEEDDYDAE